MAEMNNIVKLAVDTYHGRPAENYTVGQSLDVLREALVDLNGGKTTLGYKDIRDGKCNGLFSIIEQILDLTVVEGLQMNDFFVNMVDFRNMAEGDKNEFVVEDANLFTVAEVANGTQAVRRQRLSGSTKFSIPTTMKMVRIYEELNRVLSGRVDFNKFIDLVSKSFENKILDDIYTMWTGLDATKLYGTEFYPAAGTYDEDTLLDVIEHVEAAAGGKPAIVSGTKKAIRPMNSALVGNAAKEALDRDGFVGSFYGSKVIALPQRHKIGTKTFQFRDDVINVVAGDEKPIKFKTSRSEMRVA